MCMCTRVCPRTCSGFPSERNIHKMDASRSQQPATTTRKRRVSSPRGALPAPRTQCFPMGVRTPTSHSTGLRLFFRRREEGIAWWLFFRVCCLLSVLHLRGPSPLCGRGRLSPLLSCELRCVKGPHGVYPLYWQWTLLPVWGMWLVMLGTSWSLSSGAHTHFSCVRRRLKLPGLLSRDISSQSRFSRLKGFSHFLGPWAGG